MTRGTLFLKSEVQCRYQYNTELENQFDPYLRWIARNEEKISLNTTSEVSYKIVFMEECAGNWDLTKYNADIVILYSMKGELDENAVGAILQYFEEYKDITMVYADEDYLISEDDLAKVKNENILWQIGMDVDHLNDGRTGRVAPWFKPDYSPDTLLSFQYFGNIVALQTKRIRRANVEILTTPDSYINLYDFFLKLSEKSEIGHLSKVLFHRHSLPSVAMPSGARKKYNDIKLEAIKRRGMMANFELDKEGYSHIRYVPDYRPLVSVIIPSKDHPELLRKCIESIKEHTTYTRYELIVVDNGSSEANKEQIMELKSQHGFQYLYEKMEFNFSKMCNIGAAVSKGELLLFLNDDIEVIQDGWMDILVGQAYVSHTGAVGVKLLYPDRETIQHAGVSNLAVGPVHRLHGYSDRSSIYYGRNRMTYNTLAVTAATMMVRRSLFDQVDGFREDLKVAYNDVDFCFKLYEAGFMNVIRNDVCLIHHESLSRGNDLTGEKRLRLDQEREMLYGFHKCFAPELEASAKKMESKVLDPYCHNTEYWKRNSLYMAGILEDQDNQNKFSEVIKIRETGYRNTDNDIVIKKKDLMMPKTRFFDRTHIMMNIDRMQDMGDFVEIEGWTLVTKHDNALFRKHLLLKGEKQELYVIQPMDVLRTDVEENIEGQVNVLMSGFVLRIKKEVFSGDRYQLGACFVSLTNKKYYVAYSEEYLIWDE